ncbi:MAG: NAD-dependent epimerase/dehydratase family protein, partial [Nitrospinota bacterium]
DVVALARSPEKAASLERLGAAATLGDLTQPATFRQAAARCDVIVHLATPTFIGRIGQRRVRILGEQKLSQTKNLLAAASGDTPVILSEGILVFGECGQRRVDETAPYRPTGFAHIGAPATAYALRLAEEENRPLIRMLPGGVYGAGSWFKDSLYRLLKRGWFRMVGDGHNLVSYVHVDDVAEAYRLAVERRPVGETFALVDDEPTTTAAFVTFLAEHMDKPPPKGLPRWVVAAVAGSVVAESMTTNCGVRNRKAKERLGWELRYPTYRDGIPATLAEIEQGER